MTPETPYFQIQQQLKYCDEENRNGSCFLHILYEAGIALKDHQLVHWKSVCSECDSSLANNQVLGLLYNECMKTTTHCFINSEEINIFQLTSEESNDLLTNCFRCLSFSTQAYEAKKSLNKKIVLLENDAISAKILSSFLEEEGYEVKLFDSAKKALSHIKSTLVDLVITDILLPDSESGAFIKQVSGKHKTPVIAISSTSTRQLFNSGQEALNVGARSFFSKPLKYDDLGDCIEQIFQIR